MATPVRHSVELNTVGELHLVLIVKPTALLSPLDCSPCFFFLLLAPIRDLSVVGELVLFVLVLSSSCTPPSLRDTSRGRDDGADRDALLTCR